MILFILKTLSYFYKSGPVIRKCLEEAKESRSDLSRLKRNIEYWWVQIEYHNITFQQPGEQHQEYLDEYLRQLKDTEEEMLMNKNALKRLFGIVK